MSNLDKFTWGAVFLICLISLFGGCQYLNKMLDLEDENIYEVAIEALIESETGISVDLTP